jgi:general secretion pathway protein G
MGLGFVGIMAFGMMLYALLPQSGSHPGQLPAAQSDLESLRLAIDKVRADVGHLPTVSDGLDSLLSDPGVSRWNGPYLQQIPKDPWGNDYIYVVAGDSRFALRSSGPNGRAADADDLVLDSQ